MTNEIPRAAEVDLCWAADAAAALMGPMAFELEQPNYRVWIKFADTPTGRMFVLYQVEGLATGAAILTCTDRDLAHKIARMVDELELDLDDFISRGAIDDLDDMLILICQACQDEDQALEIRIKGVDLPTGRRTYTCTACKQTIFIDEQPTHVNERCPVLAHREADALRAAVESYIPQLGLMASKVDAYAKAAGITFELAAEMIMDVIRARTGWKFGTYVQAWLVGKQGSYRLIAKDALGNMIKADCFPDAAALTMGTICSYQREALALIQKRWPEAEGADWREFGIWAN